MSLQYVFITIIMGQVSHIAPFLDHKQVRVVSVKWAGALILPKDWPPEHVSCSGFQVTHACIDRYSLSHNTCPDDKHHVFCFDMYIAGE